MAELRAKAQAEDKKTAEELGLNFEDLTGRYSDFRLAVVGKLSGAELTIATELRRRHKQRVNIRRRRYNCGR